jgi:lipid A ethanolaminephosphotransferase
MGPASSPPPRRIDAQTRIEPAESRSGILGRGLRRELAAPGVIVGVALFVAIFDNEPFWRRTLQATLGDAHQAGVLLSLLAILSCTIAAAMSLAVGTRLLKAVAAAILVLASITGFFMTEYGIVIDASMIRNVFATQTQEAAPLLGSALALHVALFGVAPAVLVALVPLHEPSWRRALAARALLLGLSAAALLGISYANYGPLSFFAHQHHSLRLLLNPGYPLYALARYVFREQDGPAAARLALDARREEVRPSGERPVLTILVLGETARADRFSLHGYTRDTNRFTRTLGLIDFADVTACGTSTAESVPCLFSDLGHDHFTHAAANARENLIGLLERLGVATFWRDNSTGCKDVCDPQRFVELAGATDPVLCGATGCYDEILLRDLETLVADASRDRFIVLHQRGSHGPAYHTDAPPWIKAFEPECALSNLRNCSIETLNNAYDNTILYTDYFLARVVEVL